MQRFQIDDAIPTYNCRAIAVRRSAVYRHQSTCTWLIQILRLKTIKLGQMQYLLLSDSQLSDGIITWQELAKQKMTLLIKILPNMISGKCLAWSTKVYRAYVLKSTLIEVGMLLWLHIKSHRTNNTNTRVENDASKTSNISEKINEKNKNKGNRKKPTKIRKTGKNQGNQTK
jgi:hypothetical protein